MKALKISLALIAIAMLTVSGVQSNKVVSDDVNYETKSNFDLLATNKKQLKKPSAG